MTQNLNELNAHILPSEDEMEIKRASSSGSLKFLSCDEAIELLRNDTDEIVIERVKVPNPNDNDTQGVNKFNLFLEQVAISTRLVKLGLDHQPFGKLSKPTLIYAAKSLSQCISMRELDLSACSLKDIEDLPEFLGLLLTSKSLTKLVLSYNSYALHEPSKLAAVIQIISNCTSLVNISLRGTLILEELLKKFQLPNDINNISAQNFIEEILAEDAKVRLSFSQLEKLKNIEEFDLRLCKIGSKPIRDTLPHYFNTFVNLPKLRRLNLADNELYKLGKENLKVCLQSLAQCSNLEELDLTGNLLEEKASELDLQSIIDFLKSKLPRLNIILPARFDASYQAKPNSLTYAVKDDAERINKKLTKKISVKKQKSVLPKRLNTADAKTSAILNSNAIAAFYYQENLNNILTSEIKINFSRNYATYFDSSCPLIQESIIDKVNFHRRHDLSSLLPSLDSLPVMKIKLQIEQKPIQDPKPLNENVSNAEDSKNAMYDETIIDVLTNSSFNAETNIFDHHQENNQQTTQTFEHSNQAEANSLEKDVNDLLTSATIAEIELLNSTAPILELQDSLPESQILTDKTPAEEINTLPPLSEVTVKEKLDNIENDLIEAKSFPETTENLLEITELPVQAEILLSNQPMPIDEQKELINDINNSNITISKEKSVTSVTGALAEHPLKTKAANSEYNNEHNEPNPIVEEKDEQFLGETMQVDQPDLLFKAAETLIEVKSENIQTTNPIDEEDGKLEFYDEKNQEESIEEEESEESVKSESNDSQLDISEMDKLENILEEQMKSSISSSMSDIEQENKIGKEELADENKDSISNEPDSASEEEQPKSSESESSHTSPPRTLKNIMQFLIDNFGIYTLNQAMNNVEKVFEALAANPNEAKDWLQYIQDLEMKIKELEEIIESLKALLEHRTLKGGLLGKLYKMKNDALIEVLIENELTVLWYESLLAKFCDYDETNMQNLILKEITEKASKSLTSNNKLLLDANHIYSFIIKKLASEFSSSREQTKNMNVHINTLCNKLQVKEYIEKIRKHLRDELNKDKEDFYDESYKVSNLNFSSKDNKKSDIAIRMSELIAKNGLFSSLSKEIINQTVNDSLNTFDVDDESSESKQSIIL